MSDIKTSKHSSLIGGSTACRIISCPASYSTLQKIPDNVETSSIYAETGTALHEAVADCIINERDPNELLGAIVNGITIDHDRVAALRCVLDVVDPLLTPDAEFVVEARVAFPGIHNAFGTTDLGIRRGRRVLVLDWKFGTGVAVPIAHDGFVNPQLLFYAGALRHSLPDFCEGVDEYELGILQPAFSSELDSTIVTPADLDVFEKQVQAAVNDALSDEPRRARGPWCRFAACKPICSEWTKPLLSLPLFELPQKRDPDYGQFLAAGLELATLVEPIIQEFRNQAHAFVEHGGRVAGWKLVPRRAIRRWVDENKATGALVKAGLDPAEIMELRSPAQVEKIAKANAVKLPKDAKTEAISSGSTLARDDDPRPELPGAGVVIETFRQALAEMEMIR